MNFRNIVRKIVPLKFRKIAKYGFRIKKNIISSNTICNETVMKKCIICGNEFDYFLAGGSTEELFSKHHIIGGGYRKNCACPKCGIIDRERWLYYVIKNKTDIEKLNGKILHFAPEKSIIDYISSNKNIDYYTCDIQIGRAMHIVDITNIQFKDETFDYVICNHVMEHIPNEKKAISEIKRVLKKDGKWIFSFPICTDMVTQEDKKVVSAEDRLRLYGQEDHVRLYGKDFAKRFEKYGLNIEIYSPKKELKKDKIEQYGLISDDIIMIATKK